MSNAQIFYAFLVGMVSTTGAFFGSWLSARAAIKSSANALQGIDRQISLQSATKISEFRQAWINELREAMSNYHSYGVTPNLDQTQVREFFKYGTQVELMMNREDPQYSRLQNAMYCFLSAKTEEEKFACNAEYVLVCQDILKGEWEVLKKQISAAARST